MAFISKETPTGTIDGANTTFDTVNSINQIDDVWVDGAIYLGTVTLDGGTQFTLADAPTVSLEVDYWSTAPTLAGDITGADARTAFNRYKRDITDVGVSTFLEWLDYMNKFYYRKMIGVDPGRFVQTTDYTITTSPSTEALPSDFKTIGTYETGFYIVNDNDDNETATRLVRTGYGSKQIGYYIEGTNQVTFTGINASKTVRLRYIPVCATIDETTDEILIPQEYQEYVMKALDVLYCQWDEEPGSESFADFRFVRLLNEMLDTIQREPAAYSLPDLSNYY